MPRALVTCSILLSQKRQIGQIGHMNAKRLPATSVGVESSTEWPNVGVARFRRYEWWDVLTPIGWLFIFALIGSVMLGSALAFVT